MLGPSIIGFDLSHVYILHGHEAVDNLKCIIVAMKRS